MQDRILTIGTRGSALAMEQARRVKAGLADECSIEVLTTSGDRFSEEPLGERNPVGFFTKEIEDALQDGRIDLAVHSLKDLPVRLLPGLALAAVLPRDDPADVLLVRAKALADGPVLPLRQGAVVGASSRRRVALLAHFRPDLVAKPIRGNVPTRVDKVRLGDYDAILLSRAGLARLGLSVDPLAAFELNPRRWPCAPGQAIIAVEVRADDAEALARCAAMNDATTRDRSGLERDLLEAFGGGCHAPFGAYCEAAPGRAALTASAPGADGVFRIGRFEAADAAGAADLARAWIAAGCGPVDSGEDEWICRRARPWC